MYYWSVNGLKLSVANVARRLGISNSAVSRALRRGAKLAGENNLKFPSTKRKKTPPSPKCLFVYFIFFGYFHCLPASCRLILDKNRRNY
jgi:hypothetical protein